MILVGVGVTMLLAVAAGAVVTDSDDSAAAGALLPGTTIAPDTTQATQRASSTTEAQPTTTTSQATSASTTEPPPSTTTTIAPEETIAAFIAEFSAAIAAGNVDWLYDNLHPAMSLGYGEDVCRNFIVNDILALTEYMLTGMIDGPLSKTLSTGVADVTVSNIYTAETSFVFQGTQFDAKADFVLEDSVTWLAICR
jgi:hypothetical protein